MKGAGIILRKELKRVFGDRKLVFSLFILPAVLVIGIYGLMGTMIGSMEKDITEHVSEVYVVNTNKKLDAAIAATGYDKMANINYISQSEYDSKKSELENDVKEGIVDLVVVADPDFEAVIAAYEKAGDKLPALNICFNQTENYSAQAYNVFAGGENSVLGVMRNLLLEERLGSLELLNVFTQNDVSIFKEEKDNTEFISMMLPYLITMLLFAGAMSIGVDAIAGEKERGTLASMLITPVSRGEIVLGKLVSMAILSGISAIVYTVSMVLAMPMMGGITGEEVSGFGGVSFGASQILMLLVIMLAMVYLYVAVIGFLAVLAKDVKTASTYISPIYIVVIVAGMMTMFTSGKAIPPYRYAIPIYGNALAIKDICVNELTTGNFLLSVGGTVVLGIILTVAITKAFNSEKIMFNA